MTALQSHPSFSSLIPLWPTSMQSDESALVLRLLEMARDCPCKILLLCVNPHPNVNFTKSPGIFPCSLKPFHGEACLAFTHRPQLWINKPSTHSWPCVVSSAKGSVAVGLEVSCSITPWRSLGIREVGSAASGDWSGKTSSCNLKVEILRSFEGQHCWVLHVCCARG